MKNIAYIIIFPFAQILTILLEWLGILFALFTLMDVNLINQYFENVDIYKDETGNITCQYLFNKTLINSKGTKFGVPGVKISEVLAANYLTKTYTLVGLLVIKFLILCNDPAFTKN